MNENDYLTPLYLFHERIVLELFPDGITEEEAFYLYALLHCWTIRLAGPVILDEPDIRELEPLNQKNAACALALLWPKEDRRSHYEYWYWMWNCDWNGYEHLLMLTAEEKHALDAMKRKIEGHAFVKELVGEE